MKRTRWSVILPLVLLAVACQPTEESAEPASASAAYTARWQYGNDLEISCEAEHCEASDSFTPMSVTVDDA